MIAVQIEFLGVPKLSEPPIRVLLSGHLPLTVYFRRWLPVQGRRPRIWPFFVTWNLLQ